MTIERAQHTPGPWVIDDRPLYDPNAGGLNATPAERGACVANVETAFSTHTIRAPKTIGQPCPIATDWNAIGLANAHLITAAPDLLVVARDADRIERLLSERSENCARINGAGRTTPVESVLAARRRLQEIEVELREIRTRRDVAIAKAEGRS